MLVTLSGIVTLVRSYKLQNAYFPMLVTPSGIVTSPPTPLIRLLPSFVNNNPEVDIYMALDSSTTNDPTLRRDENTPSAIDSTPAGIMTLVHTSSAIDERDCTPVTVMPLIVEGMYSDSP